jgi:hypothetical protein
MRPDAIRSIHGAERGNRSSGTCWLMILGGCILVSAGCEEEPRHTPGERGVSSRPEDSGPIIGQRTQKIIKAAPALEQKRAKVASTKIVAKDPFTLAGNAYVASIGRLSQLAIEDAINKYHAANDRYPKDLDEFMTEIIKANNISLPKLPTYQEYSYNEKEHKLIIIEYPDRK